jgi:cold shock CspA family protein
MGEKVQSERIFEDILMRENIVTHYLPLRFNENNVAQEKGIDVWLALEAYELAIYKHFDILVLVAGDGDYVPLVRKLHTLGTQVMLICWDFSYHSESGGVVETKTSRLLMEEVFHPVLMHQRIEQARQNDQNGGYMNKLFVQDRIDYSPFPPGNKNSREGENAKDPVEERYSLILSVNNGFGFIKDEERNNIFFHYSTVTNNDFSELQPGMKVRYTVEEDEVRTKTDGAPRLRAVKVTVIE